MEGQQRATIISMSQYLAKIQKIMRYFEFLQLEASSIAIACKYQAQRYEESNIEED